MWEGKVWGKKKGEQDLWRKGKVCVEGEAVARLTWLIVVVVDPLALLSAHPGRH